MTIATVRSMAKTPLGVSTTLETSMAMVFLVPMHAYVNPMKSIFMKHQMIVTMQTQIYLLLASWKMKAFQTSIVMEKSSFVLGKQTCLLR